MAKKKLTDSKHAWHTLDEHLVSNSLSDPHLTHMFSCLGDILRSKRESAHISMSMLSRRVDHVFQCLFNGRGSAKFATPRGVTLVSGKKEADS